MEVKGGEGGLREGRAERVRASPRFPCFSLLLLLVEIHVFAINQSINQSINRN
jgi:hypothetical protein